MNDYARGHTTATLSEASMARVVLSSEFRPVWPGARLCGPAFTVRGAGGDNLALHQAVLEAPPGSVLVADLGGASFGHWGEVLTVAAQYRELAGLLIDGGVRDVAEIEALAFPVFSRNNSILSTRKDFPGTFGRPVTIGGVTIHTDDLIVGDVDGIVALTARDIEEILDRADSRVMKEKRIMKHVRNGLTTVGLYRLDAAGRSPM